MPHDHHDHDHLSPSGHPFRPDNDQPLSHWQVMEIAVRELMIEKGVMTATEINAQVEAMDRDSTGFGKHENNILRREIDELGLSRPVGNRALGQPRQVRAVGR